MGRSSVTSLVVVVLVSSLAGIECLSFAQYHSLMSMSHSLTRRVANLRAARGDHAGAARARRISTAMERGLGPGFLNFTFSVGYDYLKNYAWSWRTTDASQLKDLISSLSDFIQMDSVHQRAAWVSRNHDKLIRLSRGLLQTFSRPGPLKELMEALHKEVVDGDLFKDCLHLGNNDFVAALQLLKDIATQYYRPSSSTKTDL